MKNNEFVKDFIATGDVIIPVSLKVENTPNGKIYYWYGRKLNPAGLSPVLHKYSSYDRVNTGMMYRITVMNSVRYYKSIATSIEEVTIHVNVDPVTINN